MYGFGGVPLYLGPILTEEHQLRLIRCWNLLGEYQDEYGVSQVGMELKVDGKMGALGAYHKAAKNT